MKTLFLLILSFSLFMPLHAQTLEGTFSCQGEDKATSAVQLTAIAGQPFEGTAAGSPLSYGFIESVSTANEYTYVRSLTLEDDKISIEPGGQLPLSVAFSPEEVDNPMVSWFSSDPMIATVEEGVVAAWHEGRSTVTVVSACGVYADMCEVTVETDPTSMETIDRNHRVRITQEYLYLDLQQAQTVYMVDLAGRSCTELVCRAGENRIPIHTYPSGIYLLRMNHGTVKIMKP